MNLTERFLSASRDIWNTYYTHPFVKGIADGTLDINKFRYYIIQDYLYLIDYAKVFSIGAAKARDINTMQFFSSYANLIFSYETDIHKGYIQRLEISQEELRGAEMGLSSISYVSYMLRIAYEGSAAETLAAVISCALSYEAIGRKIAAENPDSVNYPMYGDWIKGYASDAYRDANLKISALANKTAENLSEMQIQRLTDIFVTCSKYEYAFWEMAWTAGK